MDGFQYVEQYELYYADVIMIQSKGTVGFCGRGGAGGGGVVIAFHYKESLRRLSFSLNVN